MISEHNTVRFPSAGQDDWRVIANPLTGVRITFLETAAETHGARIVMRMEMAPGSRVAPELHTKFTETHEVLEGTLSLAAGGEMNSLTPGHAVSIPPRTVHALHNGSTAPVILRVIMNPGSEAECGLRAYFGLARDGLVTPAGMPKNLFIGALVLHRSGTYFPPLPILLSQITFGALAVVGRLIGGPKTIARYCEPPSPTDGTMPPPNR
ncbi:MAG: cupin domain-containing protein [Candidatus Promineifilaceae bacterium]